LAGNTVWSTPERIRGEVLTTMRYTNRRLPYLTYWPTGPLLFLSSPHMWRRNKINSVLATIYFISALHVRTALLNEIKVYMYIVTSRRSYGEWDLLVDRRVQRHNTDTAEVYDTDHYHPHTVPSRSTHQRHSPPAAGTPPPGRDSDDDVDMTSCDLWRRHGRKSRRLDILCRRDTEFEERSRAALYRNKRYNDSQYTINSKS